MTENVYRNMDDQPSVYYCCECCEPENGNCYEAGEVRRSDGLWVCKDCYADYEEEQIDPVEPWDDLATAIDLWAEVSTQKTRITALEAWIEREADRRGAADATYPIEDRCATILGVTKAAFSFNAFGAQGKDCATAACQERALDRITIDGVAADYCFDCANALIDKHKAGAA